MVHEIAYGYGGPSGKKCQNTNLVSVLSKICPNVAGHD